MKKIQAPKVSSIKMQFGELKLNLCTSNGFQKINTSFIDLLILSHKLEGRLQISQQILLNLDIGCKSYSTLNWTTRLFEDTFGPLGWRGVKPRLFFHFLWSAKVAIQNVIVVLQISIVIHILDRKYHMSILLFSSTTW